jgi:hypothetical protein
MEISRKIRFGIRIVVKRKTNKYLKAKKDNGWGQMGKDGKFDNVAI